MHCFRSSRSPKKTLSVVAALLFVVLPSCGESGGDVAETTTTTTTTVPVVTTLSTIPLPPDTPPPTTTTTIPVPDSRPALLMAGTRGVELVGADGWQRSLLTDRPVSIALADGHGGVVFQEEADRAPNTVDWIEAPGAKAIRVVGVAEGVVILDDAFILDGAPTILYKLIHELPNDCPPDPEDCHWAFIEQDLVLLDLTSGTERVLGHIGSFESDFLTFRLGGDFVAAEYEPYGSAAGCVGLAGADYLLDQPGDEGIHHPQPCTLGPTEDCPADAYCHGELAFALSADGARVAIAYDRTVNRATQTTEGPPEPPVLVIVDTATADEIKRVTIGEVGQHPSIVDFDGRWAVVTMVDNAADSTTVLVGPDDTVTSLHVEGFVQLWQGPVPLTSVSPGARSTVEKAVGYVKTWLAKEFASSKPPEGVLGPGETVCAVSGPIEVGGVFACSLEPNTSPDLQLDVAGIVVYVLDAGGRSAWTAGTDAPHSAADLGEALAHAGVDLTCEDLMDLDNAQAGPLFGGASRPDDSAYFWSLVYWSLTGQPDRMDADLNGIPCETVHDASIVSQVLEGGPVR